MALCLNENQPTQRQQPFVDQFPLLILTKYSYNHFNPYDICESGSYTMIHIMYIV